MSEVVLRVTDLKKYFPVRGGAFRRPKHYVKAIDGVSLEVRRGETLAIVGESGCGKSTLGRCIVRLIEPTAGTIELDGVNVLALNKEELRALRSKMQIVHQDPGSSLDPRMPVRALVAEGLRVNHEYSRAEIDAKVGAALRAVGLNERDAQRYKHMFSGGQRQRIAVARTLVVEPSLIVLDEPTSALDVSIQAKLLNLLKQLQKQFDHVYVFISHDMRAVKAFADRVAIMYLGKIVEIGPVDEVFNRPTHPYTKALLSAVPRIEMDRPMLETFQVRGEVADPANVPLGCAFHPRCPLAEDRCRQVVPWLEGLKEGHRVACPPALAGTRPGHRGWETSLATVSPEHSAVSVVSQ